MPFGERLSVRTDRNVTRMTVLCTTFGRLVRRIAEALMAQRLQQLPLRQLGEVSVLFEQRLVRS